MSGFTSYVSFSLDDSRRDSVDSQTSEMSLQESRLLKDESIIIQCRDVICYREYSDQKQGIYGCLYVTVFRVSFVPLGADDTHEGHFFRKSLVFKDSSDISLASVDSVTIKTNDKFRLMTTELSATDQTYVVRVNTKDFRSLTFDFSKANVPAANVVNAIFYFASPKSLDPSNPRLFCLEHHCFCDAIDKQWYRFNTKEGWLKELDRTSASKTGTWRVSMLNANHTCAETYPEFCVVPQTIRDADVISAAGNWNCQRFPLWCWSSFDGNALLRCAKMCTASEVTEKCWQLFVDGIANAHPKLLAPCVFEIDPVSLLSIQVAFSSLKHLCATESLNQFWVRDTRWNAEMESTGWMVLIQVCLKSASETLVLLTKTSVICREEDGRDLSCVISSLVQICADSFYRTVDGFRFLVAKEWLSLGHAFGLRLRGLSTDKKEIHREQMAPVFLLFLDCVYQLTVQNPAAFQFSEYFLIAMWDMVISGVNGVFLVNSLRDCKMFPQLSKPWLLDSIFTQEYMQMFRNSLYAIDSGPKALIGSVKSPQHRLSRAAWIQPRYSICELELWAEMYFRWCTPVHYAQGGSVQRFLAEQNLARDLLRCRQNLLDAKDQLESSTTNKIRTKKAAKLQKGGSKELNAPVCVLNESFESDSMWDDLSIEDICSGFPYMAEILPTPDRVFTLPMVWTEKMTANKSLPECSVHFNDAQAAKSSLDARALMKTSGINRLSFADVTTGKGVITALALADSNDNNKAKSNRQQLNSSLPIRPNSTTTAVMSKPSGQRRMQIAATDTSSMTHFKPDVFRMEKQSSVQTVSYRPHGGQLNNTLV